MAEANGFDFSVLPAWAQTAAAVGITIAAFLAAMKGKWGDATLAEPPRTRADEVVERQSAEQIEILKAIRDATAAGRDASLATRDSAVMTERNLTAIREQGNRIITCQEAIVEMMRKQDDNRIDDLKRENEASKLMVRLFEKEREMDREDRRRLPHRD